VPFAPREARSWEGWHSPPLPVPPLALPAADDDAVGVAADAGALCAACVAAEVAVVPLAALPELDDAQPPAARPAVMTLIATAADAGNRMKNLQDR
jgi:hypothetical protein